MAYLTRACFPTTSTCTQACELPFQTFCTPPCPLKKGWVHPRDGPLALVPAVSIIKRRESKSSGQM